jgi:hypothetical protein
MRIFSEVLSHVYSGNLANVIQLKIKLEGGGKREDKNSSYFL